MIDFASDELIVDNFAGGGGASTGIEKALSRSVDIAINHDEEALAMHAINHPNALHLREDVWDVDIEKVLRGRRVGLAWFSPDCKHFSKAKGAAPVKKKIRGLAWVALRWAAIAKPRVIMLENVEEFVTWGPVRKGQPVKKHKGKTFKRWVQQLKDLGYKVDWRELRASPYGAPTIRKRLVVIARRDGKPIVWPVETHGPGRSKPYRTAAECIDWSLPCPSIFLTPAEAKVLKVRRPLAEATLRRIARGVWRYVINNANPFIVNLTHGGRLEDVNEPWRTVTGAHRGEKALVMPIIAGVGGRAGQSPERSVENPYQTITAKADAALVMPFLTEYANASTQRNFAADEPTRTQVASVKGGHFALVAPHITRFNQNGVGQKLDEQFDTVMAGAHRFGLVASHLMKLRGTAKDGQPVDEPMSTITSGGLHLAEVRAFLMKYYGTEQDPQLGEPMHTVTTKDRIGLVTVSGVDYQIVDIGMRMLTPRELFRAQGFPDDYVIDQGKIVRKRGNLVQITPKKLDKTAQVRMVGNSVSPPLAEAIVRAQFEVQVQEKAA